MTARRVGGVKVAGYAWNLRGRMTGVDTDGNGTDDISYVYDADGVRVRKSQSGDNVLYLVDSNNPTGYSQVIEERDATTQALRKTYALGLDVISQGEGGWWHGDPIANKRNLGAMSTISPT
jgi:hypothetical protein